jgi:Ser/Thr protein kinase RdoA (MazF antagonist)
MKDPLTSYPFEPPVEVFPFPISGQNNSLNGIRTANGDYIQKIYQCPGSSSVPSIQYEHDILTAIQQSDVSFRVPFPVADAYAERLQQGPHGWWSVYPWFPGRRLNPCDLQEITLMGDAIGQLHLALQQHPVEPRPGCALFQEFFGFPAPKYDPLHLSVADLNISHAPSAVERLSWWRDEAQELDEFVRTTYQILPWQICHNDVSPNNILVKDGQVSAVLDFEFAAPAARAFDVAMGLRMTMRVWENPEPWNSIRAFFRGYSGWIHLLEKEILALPTLIRLRNTMALLWLLGRDVDHERIPVHIGYQQNYVRWLEQHESKFLDVLDTLRI